MNKLYYYKSLNWRRPLTEDDLKILKVEYLWKLLLEQTQILNLGLVDQTIHYKSLKERWPPMEEDLKILDDQTIFYKSLKER